MSKNIYKQSLVSFSEALQPICKVPDDWLLKNKRPLIHGREVLQAVLATWQASVKELPC